ncbi:MAG TPA: hypothetical protein VLT33_06000, partial [Labilithrix sp.]|nr:hypothetical protein [Labilithrix sp.]
AERLKIDLGAATTEVHHRDSQRARYLRHHFGADNNDPTLYDVQLNTNHLALAELAGALTQMVRARTA